MLVSLVARTWRSARATVGQVDIYQERILLVSPASMSWLVSADHHILGSAPAGQSHLPGHHHLVIPDLVIPAPTGCLAATHPAVDQHHSGRRRNFNFFSSIRSNSLTRLLPVAEFSIGSTDNL